jgi:hypothetical protein
MTKVTKPSSNTLSDLSVMKNKRRGGGSYTIVREDLRGIPAGETRLRHAIGQVVKDKDRYWYIFNYLVYNRPIGEERERW